MKDPTWKGLMDLLYQVMRDKTAAGKHDAAAAIVNTYIRPGDDLPELVPVVIRTSAGCTARR